MAFNGLKYLSLCLTMHGPAFSEMFCFHFFDLIVAIQDPEFVACDLYSVNIFLSGCGNYNMTY